MSLAVACGRTPLDLRDSRNEGLLAAGGATSGGASGSSSGAGGLAGRSASGGSSGAYGTAGVSGSAGASAGMGGQPADTVPDRCASPGPPPAWGAADGSQYEFGDVLEVGDDYYDHLAVTDMNGDGRPDLVASDYFLPVISFLQLAPGVFDNGTEAVDALMTGFGASYGMRVANFEGDAAPDVLVARSLMHGLSVFINEHRWR